MKIFKLPDLGEGLPDAIVREWYVKPGDEVQADQNLVAMETAKALVDVPSPFAGKIARCFGEVGDTIETGQPLVGFEGEGEIDQSREDSGTVVGAIQQGEDVIEENATGVSRSPAKGHPVKASPAVRALAKRLGVDLASIQPQGERITKQEVEQAAHKSSTLAESFTPLSPARRAMVLSMTQSHQEVVPATLCDDADIDAWDAQQDFTIRMIRAIANACIEEPALNAHYDGNHQAVKINEQVHLGLAIDSPHGLFVPVLQDVAAQDDATIRQTVDQLKQQTQDKTIPADALRGATIMLSNFGSLAGRYASPVIVPPCVAIVAVGRSRKAVVAHENQVAIRTLLPLSITFDHRAVTGGEAARFLRSLMDELAKPTG